jgi:hypothetical protein
MAVARHGAEVGDGKGLALRNGVVSFSICRETAPNQAHPLTRAPAQEGQEIERALGPSRVTR